MSLSKQLIVLWCVVLVVAVPAAAGGTTNGGASSADRVAGAVGGGEAVEAAGAGGVDRAVGAASDFSIDEVEIVPGDPVPGEQVSVETTVSTGREEVTVDRVSVRNEAGETTAVENLWRLDGGDEATVTLSTRFDSAGTHYLWVEVTATTDDGETVEREEIVTVDVDGVGPNLGVRSDAPIADTKSTLSLRLTNTLDVPMETVKLRLDGVEVRKGEGFAANVGAGETEPFEFTVLAEEPGLRTVTATLAFSTSEHDRRSVEVPLQLDVRPLEEAVELTTDVGAGNVTATVGNGGEVPLRDVTVVAEADGEPIDRALLGSVAPHETGAVALDLSALDETSDVAVRAEYDVGTRSGTVSETITAADGLGGRIELTGVSAVDERGTVRVSGSASNVGLTPVDGAIVGVVDTDAVTPAEPSRNFFVGSVPSSDFVSFDVYATVEDDVDAIPVEVSYLVDGERVERVVEVPYEGSAGVADVRPTEQPGSDGDGLPVLPAVVVALVVAVGVVVWRRR